MRHSNLLRLKQNLIIPKITQILTKSFSEFFHPYPSTYITNHDDYLFRALIDGEHKEVEYLLRSGFNPNCRHFKTQETPLMIASDDNNLSIIKLLLKFDGNPNLQDNLGETALFKAARNCHKEVVSVLLKAGAQTDILNYENMKARDTTLDNEIDDMLA